MHRFLIQFIFSGCGPNICQLSGCALMGVMIGSLWLNQKLRSDREIGCVLWPVSRKYCLMRGICTASSFLFCFRGYFSWMINRRVSQE
jgi:hypothetical protein